MQVSDEVGITPGMQRYIDRNNEYLAKRAEYIRDVVKKWKFDTIAVHGLYTVAGRDRGLPGLDHRADLHDAPPRPTATPTRWRRRWPT